MKLRTVLLIVICLLLASGLACAGDDFQYWSQVLLKPYKGEKFDFIVFSDTRFMNDTGKLGLYFVSPRMIYHYSQNLDFGINYTHIQSRNVSSSAVDDSYNWQHRAEVEINPQWALTDWLKVKMRNRVEFRWIESKGSDNTRYRQRWTFDVPVKNGTLLKSIYLNSEMFYDSNKRNINENRSVPLGLKFKMSDQLSLNLFYMIQSKKGVRDWSSNQILGTLVSFGF